MGRSTDTSLRLFGSYPLKTVVHFGSSQFKNINRRFKAIQAIRNGGVFSRVYYWKANQGKITHRYKNLKHYLFPVFHFLDSGAKKNFNPHPLFDTGFYRRNNPDIVAAGVNPLIHFLKTWKKERRTPHPLFDTKYYLQKYPQAADARLNPIAHFIKYCRKEKSSPHPLFDTAYYLKSKPKLAGANPLLHFLTVGGKEKRNPNPLFDTAYYLANYPDVAANGINPLVHYVLFGAQERRNPHPFFNTSYYLDQNPDVAAAKTNPLVHFLMFGAREGRSPHPLFDTAFYFKHNPDVVAAGVNPLVHFLHHGAKEKRNPHPLFDATYYLEGNPELSTVNGNALLHFLTVGAQEKRNPHPLFDTAYYLSGNPYLSAAGSNPLAHFVTVGVRERRNPHPLFDTDYYLKGNPNLSAVGGNPLVHYLAMGAKERRNPHPLFDTAFYLNGNKDVTAFPNPLLHFIRYGARENRNPHPLFNTKFYRRRHPRLEFYPENPLIDYLYRVSVEKQRYRINNNPLLLSVLEEYTMAPLNHMNQKLSVVIPTCNRVEILDLTLQRCLQVSKNLNIEFIVVSDGCTDGTLDRLAWYSRTFKNVKIVAIEKSGPGRARNLGATKASGEVILFMGDDIRPVHAEFFLAHLRAHEEFKEIGTLVEGTVKWPNQPGFKINAVMRHIQGRGAQQFGYYYMKPGEFFGWRHFWTANISLKRGLIKNWEKDGFNPVFDQALYEDIEFAFRLHKKIKDFKIYYASESVAEHYHQYTMDDFMRRQGAAGRMARKLVALHPNFSNEFGVDDLESAIATPGHSGQDEALIAHYKNVIAGIKSWGSILNSYEDLGSQEWHDHYMSALFSLCHSEGFIETFQNSKANLGEAYRVILQKFHLDILASQSTSMRLNSLPLF